MKICLSFLLFCCFLCGRAQTSTVDPFQHPVILQHYDAAQLATLQQTDSLKFKTIVYYYTQSYIFETVDDNSPTPQAESSFDVSKYEYLRKKDKRYERYFEKYGFKLTLLSIDELVYKLPIQTP